MSSPVKYEIVHDLDVGIYLSRGWELYGSPFINHAGNVLQAMVRSYN